METTRSLPGTLPAQVERNPIVRSTLVTFLPSVLLVLWMAAGTLATIGFALAGGGPAPLRLLAAGGALAACAVALARLWYSRWGATDTELNCELPGDAIIPRPTIDVTRAVLIEAPAAIVWKWLVQIGRGRGGLFSYDWLENLAGLDIHTRDEIDPGLQSLAIGDLVALGPGKNNGMLVGELVHERALVLRFCDPERGRPMEHHARHRWHDVTWAFVLVPCGPYRTRLLSRFRIGGWPRRPLQLLYTLFIEIPHFVMERKMLRVLKEKSERIAITGRDL